MAEDNRNNDPYLSCKFHVEIDGIIAAGFSDVSGLQTEIETEDHREGGRNDYVFKFRKINKYQNIVLKRGFTSSDALWKWHLRVVAGDIERKTIHVLLLDNVKETEKWRWTFENAFPVKWTGPELKADQNAVAIESLELVHHGLTGGPK